MTPPAPEPLGTRAHAWGESPVWWENALWQVDIEGQALVRLSPDTGDEHLWHMQSRIGFALPCRNGHWIWGGDRGLYTFDPARGTHQHIADPEPHKPHNRFNDAAVSPDGRLFAGTIALDKTPGNAALYRLEPDHTLRTVYPAATNSNGIAWSPDGRTCHYIDTPTRQVLRFHYDPATGDLSNPETSIDTAPVIDASPDGMCADRDGGLWIAFCHGGCVIRFDPATGQPDRHLDLPCRETTACCFGGPDLRDLYVTTGLPDDHPEPLAGHTFVFRNLDRQGIPQNAIR